jgi:hypothetical protein
MATFTKFNCFVEDLCQAEHNFASHTFKVALCAAANAPVATNTVLANLTVASVSNLDSVTLAITGHGQTSGTFKLVVTDKVMTASGAVGPFRYVVIYNDTATAASDPLIGYLDYTSEVTLAAGDTFTLNFDDANGLFQLA